MSFVVATKLEPEPEPEQEPEPQPEQELLPGAGCRLLLTSAVAITFHGRWQ